MPRVESISVIIPAYNEEKNIAAVVEGTFAVLRGLKTEHEVLVVNDGSKDSTGKALDGLKKKHKNLRVIAFPKNRGVGFGMKTLFREARNDLVFDLPADGQQPPEEIKLFLPLIKGNDVVCGYRKKRVDASYRLWFKRLYHLILRILFGIKVRDIDWVKMYRRKVLQGISIRSESSFVLAEAVIRAKRKGYRITEVGVTHKPRLHGTQTGAKPMVMIRQLLDVFKFWFGINFRQA